MGSSFSSSSHFYTNEHLACQDIPPKHNIAWICNTLYSIKITNKTHSSVTENTQIMLVEITLVSITLFFCKLRNCIIPSAAGCLLSVQLLRTVCSQVQREARICSVLWYLFSQKSAWSLCTLADVILKWIRAHPVLYLKHFNIKIQSSVYIRGGLGKIFTIDL